MQNRLLSREPVTLMSYLTKIKATVTVVSATDIWTSSANGLTNGDIVLLSNSGGALPDGASATTRYYVKTIDADTFYLYTDSEFRTLLNVTDTGSGTNSFNLQCRAMNVADYMHVEVDIETANSFNGVIKCAISNEKTCPNFSAAASTTNPWKYAQMKFLDTAGTVNGSTGITDITGTDVYRTYEINTNGQEWIFFPITWTAGTLNIKIRGYGNI